MREIYVQPLHEDIAELQLRWWQCSGSNLAVAGESGSTSEAEAAATEVIVFVAEENVIVENSGKAAEEGDDDYAKAACAVRRLSVPHHCAQRPREPSVQKQQQFAGSYQRGRY